MIYDEFACQRKPRFQYLKTLMFKKKVGHSWILSMVLNGDPYLPQLGDVPCISDILGARPCIKKPATGQAKGSIISPLCYASSSLNLGNWELGTFSLKYRFLWVIWMVADWAAYH